MAHLDFHPLRVIELSELTDDSVAVTFDVPDHLRDTFSYLPGQHVIVKADIDGRPIQRSYSICANARSGKLRVGIRRLPGGSFSTWATRELRAGDVLDVMPPIGDFTIDLDRPGGEGLHRCAIVAGSGITPVMSLVSSTLESDPTCRWTVVYGNRRASTVMFLDELEGLKDRHPSRLHLIHVLSREETVPLLSGRIDEPRLLGLFGSLVDFASIDEWYLCGPQPMVETARRVLEGRGADPETVHDELFFSEGPSGTPMREDETEGDVTLVFTLDGRSSTIRMDEATPVLDAALRVRPELPFSCRGGMCASCKARVVEGDVEMTKNYALVERDLESGFTLTCQSLPRSERVVVDFDQR